MSVGGCGDSQILGPQPVALDPSPATELYVTNYDGTIYEVTDAGAATAITYQEWRDDFGFRAPMPAPTDYVRYPWSPTLYAVTFWSTADSSTWLWHPLAFAEWRRAGSPNARAAGYIAGSSFFKWFNSPELFVTAQDGVTHKLTGPEWRDSGYHSYETRTNQGYGKLWWAPGPIAYLSDLGNGYGTPISYQQWTSAGSPTPGSYTRFAGDQFYRDACSSTVMYAGPTMNRAVSYAEYQAAGSPSVDVTDVRNCGANSGGAPSTSGSYYPNCAAVRAAGQAPLYAGQPGYSFDLDRDRGRCRL